MKLLSAEWCENWSWGLVVQELLSGIPGLKIDRRFKGDISDRIYDVMICQQVTLFKNWLKTNKKIITRLGGNMTFEDIESSPAKFYLEKMSECFAVIATNRNLYEIGKMANPRTYLIPNGINLSEWKPCGRSQVFDGRDVIVGFVGNIENPAYRRYKGYDIARSATNNITGFKFRHALRGDNQIPHEDMMREFYWKIDVLLHPTAGEGCSNTLMEACACGVPIITTRESGFHGELMKDRDNVLFVERNEDSIRTALLSFSENETLRNRLSRGSRVFAEKHHDISQVADEYRKVILDCVDANKTGEDISASSDIISKLDKIIEMLEQLTKNKRRAKV